MIGAHLSRWLPPLALVLTLTAGLTQLRFPVLELTEAILMVGAWVFLVAVALRRVALEKEPLQPLSGAAAWVAAAAILVLFFGGFLSPSATVTWKHGISIASMALYAYGVWAWRCAERQAEAWAWISLAGMTFFQLALGWVQFLKLFPLTRLQAVLGDNDLTNLLEGVGLLRLIPMGDFPVGSLGNQNYLAEFLVFAIPLWFGYGLSRNGLKRWCSFSGVALMVPLLGATACRAAFIGLLAALGVFFCLALSSRKIKNLGRWAFGGVGLVATVLGVALGQPAFLERLKNIPKLQGISLISRLDIWRETLGMWSHSPIFGSGLGSFKLLINERLLQLPNGYPVYLQSVNFSNAHNEFLEFILEFGLVGLILALASILLFIRASVKVSETEHHAMAKYGFWAAQAGLFTASLAGFPYHIPATCVFVLLTCGLFIPLIAPVSSKGLYFSLLPIAAMTAISMWVGFSSAKPLYEAALCSGQAKVLWSHPEANREMSILLNRSIALGRFNSYNRQILTETLILRGELKKARDVFESTIKAHEISAWETSMMEVRLLRAENRHHEAANKLKVLDDLMHEASPYYKKKRAFVLQDSNPLDGYVI